MGFSGSACVLPITFLWQRAQKIQDLYVEYPYNKFPADCVGVG